MQVLERGPHLVLLVGQAVEAVQGPPWALQLQHMQAVHTYLRCLKRERKGQSGEAKGHQGAVTITLLPHPQAHVPLPPHTRGTSYQKRKTKKRVRSSRRGSVTRV
jgi:hypothetical protein